MKRFLLVLLGCVLVIPALFLMPVAVSADPGSTVYTNKASWEAAVGGSYLTEDFSDATLNSGVSVVSDNGYVTGGLWWDRVDDGDWYGDGVARTTTWTFDTPIYAWGGTFDAYNPGGPGSSILVTYVDGTIAVAGTISNMTAGTFWGFVSDEPFTKVHLEDAALIAGACETYIMDDMVYSLVQGVRITLPCEAETFWINYWTTVEGEGEPIMPSINCQAQMYGFALDPTSVTKFSWEAQIEYLHYLYVPNNQGDYIFSSATQTGIYVGTGGTCTQVTDKSETISGNSEGYGFWTPNFHNLIMGGDLRIKVKATTFFTEYTDEVIVHIRAENPAKQSILDRLEEPEYQVLCYKESLPKWHQFYPRGDAREGLPVCSFDCGYGLMQITNPNPTIPQIWDWRQNVDWGKDIFKGKKKAANNYIKTLISNMKLVDKKEAQIMKASFPEDGYLREAFCRYRGYHYYSWDAANNIWIKDPSSNSTSQAYADDAMNILAGIMAVPPTYPIGWLYSNNNL